jgi:hypothetical protein
MLARGFPDSICARFGFTALVEFKDPTKPKRDQRLTKDQVEFHRDWQGVVIVATSGPDAEVKLNAALIRSGAAKREDLGETT